MRIETLWEVVETGVRGGGPSVTAGGTVGRVSRVRHNINTGRKESRGSEPEVQPSDTSSKTEVDDTAPEVRLVSVGGLIKTLRSPS